ncbi:putative RNA binding protein [Aspergillus homomorphus CBS 101889]|uniref:Uncharacterized protein n=1 Tax=Aspergillus homomorphus (strain CBS 101889) TaxID=1450537 RepID=A0A395I2D4_ASPHC|nr:hypothetical protein BO97DRAFT_423024 [Aspergillus homomorphus CBS 101889]RAL14107.1 hypothetical protein BO97DRAFT_423024 [Aspergillus homomorphus CBS 101889]
MTREPRSRPRDAAVITRTRPPRPVSPVTEREPIRKVRSNPASPRRRAITPPTRRHSISPSRHVHFAESLEQIPPSSSDSSPVENTTTSSSGENSPKNHTPTPSPGRIPIRPTNRRGLSDDTTTRRGRIPRDYEHRRTVSPHPSLLSSTSTLRPHSHPQRRPRPRIIQEGVQELTERGSRLMASSYARRSNETIRPLRRRLPLSAYYRPRFPDEERIADEDDRSGGTRLGRWL